MMTIAFLADIHSNEAALRVCLDELARRRPDRVFFLGDYLGDLADPQHTLAMLREAQQTFDCTFLRGNKEDYWIDHRRRPDEVWTRGSNAAGMLAYNYDQLTGADIDWFETMPIAQTVHTPGYPDFIACHGSPFRANESMRPEYDYIDELAARIPAPLTVCGHFHIQTAYERAGKTVVNPGSVGVALGAPGKAQFMLLRGEAGQWAPEFISLDYDVSGTLAAMDAADLASWSPAWTAMTRHLLTKGEPSHAAVVRRIIALAGGQTPLPRIAPAVWDQALAELCNN